MSLWSGLAVDLASRGHMQMGLMLLLMVSAYLRPNEALNMKKADILAPQKCVTQYYSLLLFREELPERSKTGESDDSVVLDAEWLMWANPLWEQLRQGPAESPVWSFAYPAFLKQFRISAERIGVAVVPYQARHSGPSIDRISKLRPLDEVQKRGRWKSFKGVTRYEKAGRLQYSANSYTVQQHAYLDVCEARLGPLMLGSTSFQPSPPNC